LKGIHARSNVVDSQDRLVPYAPGRRRVKPQSRKCRGRWIMRERLANELKDAMKAGDKVRVGALRLIMAALKDREIELRGEGKSLNPAVELAALAKMVKTRQESLLIYEQAGREDLAAQERAEIAVIGEFLPRQMDEAAVSAAVRAAIAQTGAASVKDMGKVVAALKASYPGQMDFARASAIAKALLAA
jgi:hypothetical protein